MPNTIGEIWKTVPWTNGAYSVSDQGRVMHHCAKGDREIGRQWVKTNRYLTVKIGEDIWLVHRLVLTVFVGPAPSQHQGHHHNGRKNDNRLANLSWLSQTANMLHARQNGHTYDRAGSPQLSPVAGRFTAEQLFEIRNTEGQTQRLALKFGVSEHMIRRARAS